jgi:uncharacterized protein
MLFQKNGQFILHLAQQFMKNSALIIFVRNPVLGKVKTRLARIIGDQKAFEVYNELLFHTMTQTIAVEVDKFVFYDIKIDENDIWSDQIFYKKIQQGEDLGVRMQNAFRNILDLGYKKVVIIGSDLFDLTTNHIINAFDKLEKNDAVIGPAEDGGYYLLGLKKTIPKVFESKNWGTSTVFNDTLKDLENHKIDFLETLNDIDTFEDLEKHINHKTK